MPTQLTPLEEIQYNDWKKENAPNIPDSDSLRSAFKESTGEVGSDINPVRTTAQEIVTPTFADVAKASASAGNALDTALLNMKQTGVQSSTTPEALTNLSQFLNNAKVTQGFGEKTFSFYGAGGHEGVDYSAAVGTPLHGLKGWTVESAGKGPSYYGNTITLKNTDTGEKIEFAHLNNVNVKPGEVISDDNQVIGTTGASGTRPDKQTQQAHLHVNYYDKNGVKSDVTKLAEKTVTPTTTTPKTTTQPTTQPVQQIQTAATNAAANFPIVPTATQAVKTAQTKIQQPATFISANKDQSYNGNGYLVKSGDSLSKIARDLGTTVGTLMAKNNITNANKIYSGDVIRY